MKKPAWLTLADFPTKQRADYMVKSLSEAASVVVTDDDVWEMDAGNFIWLTVHGALYAHVEFPRFAVLVVREKEL